MWDVAQPELTPQLPVTGNIDVVVFGAGYTGLSATLILWRAGLSVQVFNRQNLEEDASTRNGGIASGNIHIFFGEMTQRYNLDYAKPFYSAGKAARKSLNQFIKDELRDCDFNITRRFTTAANPEHYKLQVREVDFTNVHLETEAYMTSKADQYK